MATWKHREQWRWGWVLWWARWWRRWALVDQVVRVVAVAATETAMGSRLEPVSWDGSSRTQGVVARTAGVVVVVVVVGTQKAERGEQGTPWAAFRENQASPWETKEARAGRDRRRRVQTSD